jgi:hypothetical protein
MFTFLTSFTTIINEVLNYWRQNISSEQLLIDIIILFIFLIVLSIVFIFNYLFRKKKRWLRKVFLQNSLNSFIGEIAICETENELTEIFSNVDYQKVLLQFQHTESDRNLLISELAETSKKFRGATMENLLWLFEKIDLEKQLLKNLDNKKWHKKAKAIQQLAYLRQKSSIKYIIPFTNHENDLLRMEAQIAVVKMTGFEGLEFLNKVTYPVSEWQQLRLIEELSSHRGASFGNIYQWLKSENISVVNFALRLVEIYQQYDFYEEVKSCLSHSSMSLCQNAVATIINISNETTADLLVACFEDYDATIQLKILKFLQSDGTENQLPFLLSVLKHPDDSYKLEAAKAILKISDTGLFKIEESIDTNLFPWNIILPQIKNVA